MVLSQHIYNYVNSELAEVDGNYLEIGIFNGIGFAEVARRHPGRRCIAIDPFVEDGNTQAASGVVQGARMSAQESSSRSHCQGLNNVELNVMTTAEFAEQHTPDQLRDLRVGMVVIDGDHSYAAVKQDCALAVDLLGDSGWVVFDDLDIPGVGQAATEFLQDLADRVDYVNTITNTALAVKLKR